MKGTGAWLPGLVLAGLAACSGQAAQPAGEQAGTRPVACKGETADPWLGEFRERIERYNSLYRFAQSAHGPVAACEGRVTGSFEDRKFGSLRFEFEGGVQMEVETTPPEASRLTLRGADGIPSPAKVLEALESHVKGIGVNLRWSEPREEETEGGRRVSFVPSEEGLNAEAVAIYEGERLVEISFSLAL